MPEPLQSRGFHQTGNTERLLFEPVIPIGIQTANQGRCARQQIENRKERPPAFVLPNVNTFVVSAPNQAIAVLAKDDMPDGDGIYRNMRVEAVQQEEAIPPSASMTPAAMTTAPPERMTKGSSTMPMQDTGRTQQYLMHEPTVLMKFIFFIPDKYCIL